MLNLEGIQARTKTSSFSSLVAVPMQCLNRSNKPATMLHAVVWLTQELMAMGNNSFLPSAVT